MSPPNDAPADPRSSPDWAPAIAYAVVGRVPPGLARQPEPDVDAVLADLARLRADLPAVSETVRLSPGPFLVPAELTERLGAAQWLAVLGDLRRRLGAGLARTPVSERTLDADERRLSADRPPHHGT